MKIEKMEFRGEEISIIRLSRWTSNAKEWAALVTGTDPKYGLALDFCETVQRLWSHSGKNGFTITKLKGRGYYRISNPISGKYGKKAISCYYWDGESEEMEKVNENEVYKYYKV